MHPRANYALRRYAKTSNKMGNKAITIVISHRQQWDRNMSLKGSSRKKFSKLSLSHLGNISEGKIYPHSPRLLATSCICYILKFKENSIGLSLWGCYTVTGELVHNIGIL